MFRKRKEPESAAGINRISRMIEQRQRESAGESDDEMLAEDDTIVMNHADASADPEEQGSAVSLLGIRAAPPAEPAPVVQRGGYADAADEQDNDRDAPAGEAYAASEPPSAFAQQAYATPAIPPWQTQPEPEPAAPSYAMPVPNIGAAAGGGTLIAADAEWEGKLVAQGDVRVEGVLRGELETEGTLTVAPQAQVHGTIHARDIVIGGDVEGEVLCQERLEILPGGSARGQINSGTLVVHEGAYIDSRFQMRRGDGGA
jgi:cytoskeletal protein CcmA (bactofilin family)